MAILQLFVYLTTVRLFYFEIDFYLHINLNYSNILNTRKFIELETYGIFIVFDIWKCWKFAIFRNWTFSKIWWFSRFENLGDSRNFPNCKFLELSKLKIFLELSELQICWNFPNCKFLVIFHIKNSWNCPN